MWPFDAPQVNVPARGEQKYRSGIQLPVCMVVLVAAAAEIGLISVICGPINSNWANKWVRVNPPRAYNGFGGRDELCRRNFLRIYTLNHGVRVALME